MIHTCPRPPRSQTCLQKLLQKMKTWPQVSSLLTHWPLVTPYICIYIIYGITELHQHWLRWWLAAWWHQSITWTNISLSWSYACWNLTELVKDVIIIISIVRSFIKKCSWQPVLKFWNGNGTVSPYTVLWISGRPVAKCYPLRSWGTQHDPRSHPMGNPTLDKWEHD